MKTSNEIFDWLVRNSKYNHVEKTEADLEKLIAENTQDGVTLLCAVNRIPDFHADYDAFVAFVKEPYSFKKHILPLIELGLISCTGYSVDEHNYYGTETYKKILDTTWGLVKDYKTGKSFVRYWLGKLEE